MAFSVFHGDFRITGCYLQNWGHWAPPTKPHTGLDLVGDDSKQIFAPVSGTVEHAGDAGDGFGIFVKILAADGRRHYLCHMSSTAAKEGQTVKEGDFIGVMGATGNVTGAHTHYEIRTTGTTTASPADFLGLPNKQGSYNSAQVGKAAAKTTTAKTDFPGAQYFGTGKVNKYVLQLGKALVAKGYDKHYKTGPSTVWGDADRLNVQDFQHAQGWSGNDANGIPGAETWTRLGLG